MARNYRIPTHRAFSSAFYFSARILFLKEVSKQESSTERPGPNPRAPKLFASPRAGPGLHQLLRRHVLIAYCWNPCAKHSLFARLKSLLFSWSTFTSSHCKKPLMWPLRRRTWAAHPASTAMKSSEIVATVRLIEQNYMCEFTYFSQRWKVDFPPQSLLPFYTLTTSPPPPQIRKGSDDDEDTAAENGHPQLKLCHLLTCDMVASVRETDSGETPSIHQDEA